MAPTKRNILYLAGAGLAAFLIFGVKTLVDAKFLDWTIKDFKLSFTGGVIYLGIINPTSSTYTVNSINVDIYNNDDRIGLATYLGQIVIMPMATTTVSLNIKTDPVGIDLTLFDVGMQLVKQGADSDIVKGKQVENITVQGSANVDGFMIPVNATLTAFRI